MAPTDLFSLPIELRKQIYDEIARDIRGAGYPPNLNGYKPSLRWDIFDTLVRLRILHICRQIRAEAIPHFIPEMEVRALWAVPVYKHLGRDIQSSITRVRIEGMVAALKAHDDRNPYLLVKRRARKSFTEFVDAAIRNMPDLVYVKITIAERFSSNLPRFGWVTLPYETSMLRIQSLERVSLSAFEYRWPHDRVAQALESKVNWLLETRRNRSDDINGGEAGEARSRVTGRQREFKVSLEI